MEILLEQIVDENAESGFNGNGTSIPISDLVIPDGVEKVYKNGLYLYEDGLAKGTGTVIVGEDRVKFF